MRTSSTNSAPLRPTNWAMERLGYRNRGAFWSFVHANGVPFVRLNSRTARFDERSLDAWLEARSVGRIAR